MRIENYSKFSDQVVQSAQSTKKGAPAQGSAGGNAGASAPVSTTGENVTVSAQAQALARESAKVDTAKVEKLRSAIQGGTFKVNNQAVAQRIVDGE
jgi:negative regulator of flagellin synthesis FlgM